MCHGLVLRKLLNLINAGKLLIDFVCKLPWTNRIALSYNKVEIQLCLISYC